MINMKDLIKQQNQEIRKETGMVKEEEINEINFQDRKRTYQDHRAILVYLSLVYPERYYLYKYTMFSDFAKIIDYNYHPKKGRIENIGQYLHMCDLIKNDLVKDQELLKLHKGRIDEDCYYDSNYNLLTQDFIYAVTYHLSKNTSDILTIQNFHRILVFLPLLR